MRCIAALALLIPAALVAQEVDRAAICTSLSDDLVKQLSADPVRKDYRLFRVEAFYSERLDSCIHVDRKMFGPEVMVRDMTRTVITDGFSKLPPLLLHCDIYGVDEADIDAVRERRGHVANVPYEEWLTDGQGGLPRALKTPEIPYTREDCEAALERWLARWR